MWFLENFAHVGQQSKLSGVFTAKIMQYNCTTYYADEKHILLFLD
jgi:hypothetical protein